MKKKNKRKYLVFYTILISTIILSLGIIFNNHDISTKTKIVKKVSKGTAISTTTKKEEKMNYHW